MFFERPRRKGKEAIGKVQRVGEVYFDDFKVEHVKSPVIQSEDFYPFGLTFNSYQRENSTPNPLQFNGKEQQDELSLGCWTMEQGCIWLILGDGVSFPESRSI